MTTRQRVAFKNHCRLAVETMHPRFANKAGGISSITAELALER